MKKTLRETQTLRAECSKAEPKIIRSPHFLSALYKPGTLFVVSEMTYTVSSGTLNPSIPYQPIVFFAQYC